VTLERTARFVRRDPAGWSCLSMADVSEWAVWQSRPPATTLEITLVATRDRQSATRLMRVTALAPILPRAAGGARGVSP